MFQQDNFCIVFLPVDYQFFKPFGIFQLQKSFCEDSGW